MEFPPGANAWNQNSPGSASSGSSSGRRAQEHDEAIRELARLRAENEELKGQNERLTLLLADVRKQRDSGQSLVPEPPDKIIGYILLIFTIK